MTITPEQLDELEARAKAAAGRDREPSPDITLQLVAVYRAALAWTTASREAAALRVQWPHTNDDALLPKIQQFDMQIIDSRAALNRALRGEP